MLDLWYAMTAGLLTLPAFAWAVARRRREHVPLAAYATWMAASDQARRWTMRWSHEPLPLGRIAYHVDNAFVLSWTFFFVACCAHYFVGRGARLAVLAWAGMVLFTIVTYPHFTGAAFTALFNRVFVAGIVATWATVLYGVFRRRGLRPGLAHLMLLFYAATDVVIALFPILRSGLRDWPLALVAGTSCVLAGIGAHAAFLVFEARRRRIVAKV